MLYMQEKRKRLYNNYKNSALYLIIDYINLACFSSFLTLYKRVKGLNNNINKLEEHFNTFEIEIWQYKDNYNNHNYSNFFTETFNSIAGAIGKSLARETQVKALQKHIAVEIIPSKTKDSISFGTMLANILRIVKVNTLIRIIIFHILSYNKYTNDKATFLFRDLLLYLKEFKISLKDNYKFNYLIIVNIIYINNNLILYIVNSAITIALAVFLRI
ncbi:hypothetical protein BUE80_DR003635 [Diplocarpon rosae]|nr:hypothetical protein BUE80_DR003635 [Diplocarpon rosae]